MGLVAAPAKWYAKRNPWIDLDDMMQAGRIGLLRSISRFDATSSYAFSTYATYWIKHELRRIVREYHARALSSQLKDSSAYIEGRMPSDEARKYEAACLSYIPLDSPAISGDSHSDQMRDILPDEEFDLAEECEQSVLYQQIIEHIDLLPNAEQSVLRKSFAIDGEEWTDAAIARNLNISKDEVERLRESALTSVRGFIGA